MDAQEQTLNTFSTKHLQDDLKGRSVRGAIWTIGAQGAQFVLQSTATIALARLLTPSDFGLVAMVTSITTLGQAFADLGLSEATIQQPEITHEQVSNLFWINVAIGFLLTSITAGLAPVLSWFYKEPPLTSIALVLSLTFLFGGLRVQHDALLRRQMRFKSLAIRDFVAISIAVPSAIFLAWRGIGYWAIVVLPMTLTVVQVAFSWAMVDWIPSLPRRDVSVRSLVSFGGNVAAAYLVFSINGNADNVFVGRFWGAGPLGLYSRAYNLLMLPIRQLCGPARSVAVPGFSRVDDPERLARFYLRTINLMFWITAPLFGFLFVAATPVIVLTLGAHWRAAAPVFQILVIAALGQVLLESTMWLLVSQGRGRQLLNLLLVSSPITIASYAVGVHFGIKGVALCGSIVLIAIMPAILKYSFRGTRMTVRAAGENMLCPITMSCAGIGSAELILHWYVSSEMLPRLLETAAAFAIGCACTLLVKPLRRELLALKTLFERKNRAEDQPEEMAAVTSE
jgi:O-antigen/teichoic acid export membrane protein